MRRFRISTVLLLGTFTALLTGCSRNPMSPDPGTTLHGAESMGSQSDEPPASVQGGGTPGTATTSLAVGAEARLTVGRFTLDLHKNTLKMPATITMLVMSDDAMDVQIVVSPPEANDFQVAADLSASMVDLPGTDLLNTTMFTWDGADWAQIEDATGHPNQQTMVAKMTSVSLHRVGERPADDKWKNK